MVDIGFGELIEEGVRDATALVVEETSEAPNVAALRTLIGDDAKSMSDEDVKLAWEESQKEAKEAEAKVEAKPEDKPAGETKPVDTPASTAPAPLTFANRDALLAHEVEVPINGAATKLTVAQALRMAQRVPMLDQRVQELTAERSAADQRGADLERTQASYEADRKHWRWIMDDKTGARFLAAQEKYEEAMAKGEEEKPVEAAPTWTPEQEATGRAVLETQVRPAIRELVLRYSADGAPISAQHAQQLETQIENVVLQFASQEGRHLTREKLSSFFRGDLPLLIEQGGWKPVVATQRPAAPVDAKDTEIARLRHQVAKTKLSRAPGSGRETPAAAAGGKGSFVDKVSKATTAAEAIAAMHDADF